ncbi:Cathepsin-like proteinase [Ectocarpus siliculosus]|uniref:Cathepsin-like proteinase n=1 Tax=Ectocarpus siliculosus TaxID=2880 RepID=D7G512_ECTSI|nr:Cathepsin-like proteinase [Ectocarpus siliculosus]|eukprot:CBJ33775.1 Cathepsin-like proteinase [Ectocarpus siliculosus]
MTYQTMENANDGMPLLREKGSAVDVVEEGGIDEIDGTSTTSRRSRKGAALGLIVLALGAVSALSALGGKPSSQSAAATGAAAATKLSAAAPGGSDHGEFRLSPKAAEVRSSPRLSELSDQELESLFQEFGIKFEKSYENDDEKAMRFEVFKRNLKRIDERNSKSLGVKYDVTMWTDLTHEEFKGYQNYGKISDEAKEVARSKAMSTKDASDMYESCQSCTRFPELEQYITGDLPTEFDWRDYGAVTPVKNQAYCGSCWTFSTTGCLEGAWYLSGHPLESLSEQQLVACDTSYNQGCNGGWPSISMDYISKNGGIVPESIYPYRKVFMNGHLGDPVCSDVVKEGNYAATLAIEVALAEDSMTEEAMARWLILNGPLSVALDAMGMDYYSEGIDMGEYCEPLEIDHAVLIVGYGEEDGVKYWIIKNSWKYLWGERGYYRLVRGVNACGIADDVTTIIVADATVE